MSKYEKYKLIILSFFCLSFLIICFKYAENGRYFIGIGDGGIATLDTRSGRIYLPSAKKFIDVSSYENIDKRKNNNE